MTMKTVEVPASLVLVSDVQSGKLYILQSEIADIICDAVGLRVAMYVHLIFELVYEDAKSMVDKLIALHRSFIDDNNHQWAATAIDLKLRDRLVIIQHSLKGVMLNAFAKDDTTGMRAHLLYALLGIILGSAKREEFSKLLARYIAEYQKLF